MQGVILAAGKGSRLHPITINRSKAMAPILGRPIVERVSETLVENGIRQLIMVVSREDEEIRRYFRAESPLDVDIHFVIQPQRLGMAHALSLAAAHIRGPFVMTACDNLVSPQHVADLLATHRAQNAHATLSLMEIEPALIPRTGIVEWRDGIVHRIVEKPALEEAPSNIASLPLYVFSERLLDYLPAVKPSPRGELELQDAIQMLIDRDGGVTGVFTPSRLQLTNPGDLLALNRHYLNNGGGTHQLASHAVGPGTRLIPPLRIEKGTTIGPDCIIGPDVYIERNCTIGAGVSIANAVILRHTTIEDGRRIAGEVIS